MYFLKRYYSFDLRSLALQRISVAFVLILDAYIRINDIVAHYTASGVLPLGSFGGFKQIFTYFPDTPITYYIWFTVYILSAFCLLIGYKTKVFTFICWWMLCQIQARNPYILQGGDDLLRLALFWLLFLPTHKRWSADSYFSKFQISNNSYFSFANIGYLCLIASVYFFSALLKNSDEWLKDGSAVYYALSLDQLVLPMGKLIYPYPWLLKILTYSVYYSELILPFFLLSPFKKLRNITVLVLLMMHLGIGSTLYVGLFFIIGISTLVTLYQGSLLDKIDNSAWLRIRIKKPILVREKIEIITNPMLNVFSILVTVYCLTWNFSSVPSFPFEFKADFQKIGYTLRLDQKWAMFAPTVFKDDGWLIAEGFTKEKQRINLFNGESPIDENKPKSVVKMFKNDRWRKYSENILFVDLSWLRYHYCKYLVKQWNAAHTLQVDSINLIYMKEVSGPNYYHFPIKKEILNSYKE
jgi:Vitamin K-dependent gamma-carboxylase